jgi:hypothetical protein
LFDDRSQPVAQAAAAPAATPPAPVVEPVMQAAVIPASVPDTTDVAPFAPAPPEPATPEPVAAAPLAETPAMPAVAEPLPAEPAAETAADSCAPILDLLPEADAMIGITLIAPCHPGERVVLSHAGLTVTQRTTATGSVFTSLPALAVEGRVTARLSDGTLAEAALVMPEAAEFGRLAVQWQGDDRFSLNAYAPGAVFGGAGHERGVALADLEAGAPLTGKVIRLGSADVDLPLLAEVYTHPQGDRNTLTLEAEVTEATCGREILGETVKSRDGQVTVEEVTLAMPDCGAVGEFLVLNIAPEDLTLAQAE